jgi:hypothetical protein
MLDILDILIGLGSGVSWAIVPSTGALSMRGLAREKQFDDYNSTSTPYTPISLLDLAETFVNFDGTNTNGVNYPDSSKPHAMSEWYGYDHDYGVSCGSLFARTLARGDNAAQACGNPQKTYYTNSSVWLSSTQLYSGNVTSCTPAVAGWYYEDSGGGQTPVRYWNGSAFTANSGCG